MIKSVHELLCEAKLRIGPNEGSTQMGVLGGIAYALMSIAEALSNQKNSTLPHGTVNELDCPKCHTRTTHTYNESANPFYRCSLCRGQVGV